MIPDFDINSNEHVSKLLFGGMFKIEVKEQVGYYKNGKEKFQKVEKLIPIQGFGLIPKREWKQKKEGIYKVDEKTLNELLQGLSDA
jgi:hypothetical protein